MGVDCVNVHQIVHWGIASKFNVESYVTCKKAEELGGMDRLLVPQFLYKASDLDSRRVSKGMID